MKQDSKKKGYASLLPEERVRQSLIRSLVQDLKYPRGLIALEKPLSSDRRVDLLVYKKDMTPLLLIECKWTERKRALDQLLGYNRELNAPFWAVVDKDGIDFFWMENGVLKTCPFIPFYNELLKKLPR